MALIQELFAIKIKMYKNMWESKNFRPFCCKEENTTGLNKLQNEATFQPRPGSGKKTGCRLIWVEKHCSRLSYLSFPFRLSGATKAKISIF